MVEKAVSKSALYILAALVFTKQCKIINRVYLKIKISRFGKHFLKFR